LWTYIQGWVFSRSGDEYVPQDRYQQELKRCGLSDELAAKHMDPEFAIFRDMQAPWYWALDTLCLRYEMLGSVMNEARLLNELRLRRDIARPDNQVGKLGSSPAQINNNLAALSDSEITWIWFDAS
jgi:hypothetical protein